METNYFQKNLAALKTTHPELAAIVEATRPDPNQYRLVSTKSGLPSLEYVAPAGETVLWYSRYDPLREVHRELSAIDRSFIFLPILGGIGLGYGLRTLWANFRNLFYDAVVLEPDPAIFRLAMEVSRLDDILSDPRLHIHLGTDIGSWMILVRNLIPSIMSCSPLYLPHAPSQKCHTPYFQTALAGLQQKIQLTQAEFDLLIRSGARIQENMWNNLPSVAGSIRLSDVRGILRERPAIVIAAGPSLDKNVSQLRGVEDRLALIAVDTAYRTLKKHGVDPHLVVATDPTELNAKHFESVAPSPQTILAFDPEVYSEIPAAWPHRRLFMNLEKAAFTRWIENDLGPFGFIPKGGSVGHTAFYLARELGADPIVFAGLDLAFDPQGGATHASASALLRAYEAIPTGANAAVLGPRFGAGPMQESIVWVPGVYGKPVPTSRIMSLYIHQFAEEFALTSSRIIDATEGGALLPGAEIMTLQQVLAACAGNEGARALFDRLAAAPIQLSTLQNSLDRIEQTLEADRLLASKGAHLALKLDSRVSEGERVRNLPEWREMESIFSTIYQSETSKVALEQALFSAVYSFIKKERLDQIDIRRAKYENYFKAASAELPRYKQIIQRVKTRLR